MNAIAPITIITRATMPMMIAFLPPSAPLNRSNKSRFSSSGGGSYGGVCERDSLSMAGPPHIGQYSNPLGRISLHDVHSFFFSSIPHSPQIALRNLRTLRTTCSQQYNLKLAGRASPLITRPLVINCKGPFLCLAADC
jgi:hypothetical protein